MEPTRGLEPEPSAYKNAGTGRSGWLPLVRLTTPLSTLDVVPAADRVSGTASGTDHPLWTLSSVRVSGSRTLTRQAGVPRWDARRVCAQ